MGDGAGCRPRDGGSGDIEGVRSVGGPAGAQRAAQDDQEQPQERGKQPKGAESGRGWVAVAAR